MPFLPPNQQRQGTEGSATTWRSLRFLQFNLIALLVLVSNYCKTRNSATADGPRDALCQSKSCQFWKQTVRQIHNKSNGIRGLQFIDL